MKKILAILSAAGALAAGDAGAAEILATTVSASGVYNGKLSVLTDGVVPPNGGSYASPLNVFYNSAAKTAVFTFDFGGRALLESFLATVDNNDNYIFSFFDGAALVGSATILTSEGRVAAGVETFTRSLPGFIATRVEVAARNGDGRYSLGEVQFTGTEIASAAPEPATWAMLIAGFGIVGASLRTRRNLAGSLI